MRRAVSPLIATLILIAVTVAAGITIYLATSGLSSVLGPRHAFNIVTADLVWSSTGGMLSVTVKNTGGVTAETVKVSIITESGTVEAAAGSTKTFYLIYVDGVSGWWVDPAQFYQGCASVLSQAQGANVVRISSLSALDDLVRRPPEGAVVINCHGERIPRPTTWDSWQSYFDALAQATMKRGWIFVTAVGYPLYYTQLEGIGPAGLNRFLSNVGASADAGGSTSHSPTTEGTEALSMFGMTPADPLSGIRTVSWSGITPSFRFYQQSGGRDLAAAVPMGTGYYLNVEVSQLSSNVDRGKYTAAFACWLADKLQLQPGETCSITIMGLPVEPGKKYPVMITVQWVDGSSSSQSFAIYCH